MAKTGERYSAARRQVVRPREELRAHDLGQTDAKVRQNTGKGWREWARILDAWGAKERKHTEIVRYLLEQQGVPGWWAQSITTGYERSRGLRAKYQTLGGSFQVSVSKTFHATCSGSSSTERWPTSCRLAMRRSPGMCSNPAPIAPSGAAD